ncbi:MAG TPA: tyrosine/phenylalanine carboxypeptidase domain-containing protein [Sphingomicrobium sp.]|nr:tyrosine/phenylalanine carboxypeptidase domain-containing protein [Sphingomicrobium sp.]
MSARADLTLASDSGDIRFGPGGSLRESFAESGRIHLDRWLPFLVLHRSSSPESSIGRRVATNSPAYLIWSPKEDEEAEATLKVVLGRLRDELGPVLLIELRDSAPDRGKPDSPRLPPFEFHVSSSGGKAAEVALKSLEGALDDIRLDHRKPKVTVDRANAQILNGEESANRLSIAIPQVHRSPEDGVYPQLMHDYASELIGALLCAAAAFMGEVAATPPPHYRSLGRSAFIAAALKADRKLDSIARSFDFLLSISPINTAEARQRFFDDGEKDQPEFRYRPLTVNPDSVKRDLYAIDLSIVEDLLLERLLSEKRREIDMQMTMLSTRNTRSFRSASTLLYGAVTDDLLEQALSIISSVKPQRPAKRVLSARQVADAANALVDNYRSIDERFEAKVEVRDDVSGMLVSGGKLMISSDSAIAEHRLDALLSHEVSVHLLTYFNGATQGLTIFRTGLAHYEGIQEGLGVFAEWAVGGLTAARLRLLAGRVVAVDAMFHGATFIEVYRLLRDNCHFARGSAFDITTRVFRSGGLAKDSIYLKGFLEVMDRMGSGASMDPFWLGKIAPADAEAIDELLQRGLLHPPVFLPEFLQREDARKRIERLASGVPLDSLLEVE